MAMQEDPEHIFSSEHIKSSTAHGTVVSETDLRTGWTERL